MTRQHILDTAEKLLLGKGFSAVGLSEILSAADVPKGSFYHYFKSKEQFGAELLAGYFARYAEQLAELLADSSVLARDRVITYFTSWSDRQGTCIQENQCLVTKLGAELCDLSESMRDELRKGTDRIIALISKAIEAGHQDGSISPVVEPDTTALLLYETWLGASLLTKLRHNDSALTAALEASDRLLLRPN